MNKAKPAGIRLRDLLLLRASSWSLALLLGSLSFLAALTLLAVSGWFITAAALAGLLLAGGSFNFFSPAAIIRLSAIIRTAGRYAERLASHHAALGLLKDLRCQVFARLGSQPASEHPGGRISQGAQLHRLVSDIDLLDYWPLRMLAPWFWACCLTLAILGFLALLAMPLFWSGLPGLLLAWLGIPLAGWIKGYRLAHQDVALAEMRREKLLDILQLHTPLLLWQQWHHQCRQLVAQDQAYLAHQLRQKYLASHLALFQQLALAITLLGLLWAGAPLVAAEQLGLPLLLAALLLVFGLHEILLPLAGSFSALGLSQAARDRINQMTGTTPSQKSSGQQLTSTTPLRLQLEKISARQPGAICGPDAISLTLQSGDSLLVTGVSGRGKSTLLAVLAGELQPLAGSYRINGQASTKVDLHALIGHLPQQLDFFNLTLAQNLRLARPNATDTELWHVLSLVRLDDWARQQPLQLATPLGEHAIAVSGGQARRIALARLLLTRRPVLLLDEPFAGVDQATADQIMAALVQHQKAGILVIASHLLPAQRCTRQVHLDQP